MLETISIPILLKAIDFLFDEGRKILEERRERRKTQKESRPTTATSSNPISTTPELKKKDDGTIQTKEAALAAPVIKNLWKESEEEVAHLLKLLEIHTRNYRLAEEQCARWGSALVPPIVSNTLLEEEEAITATIQKLQTILSQVYGKRIEIL